jgi:hypothetical protein
MTCIVGVKTPHGVYIGGDSASTNDSGLQTILASSKVFSLCHQETRMLLGCTTSCRMMQLLQYELHLPPYEGTDVVEYLVTRFVNAVRDCLKDGSTWTRSCPVFVQASSSEPRAVGRCNWCSLCSCPVS